MATAPHSTLTPRKKTPAKPGARIQHRLWDTEFHRNGQTWVLSIEVDSRPCTLIDPDGHPSEIFPGSGTYKLVFPAGSRSPLVSLAIDPDPGPGRS